MQEGLGCMNKAWDEQSGKRVPRFLRPYQLRVNFVYWLRQSNKCCTCSICLQFFRRMREGHIRYQGLIRALQKLRLGPIFKLLGHPVEWRKMGIEAGMHAFNCRGFIPFDGHTIECLLPSSYSCGRLVARFYSQMDWNQAAAAPAPAPHWATACFNQN